MLDSRCSNDSEDPLELWMEVHPHVAYTADLAPSDYHLFRWMQYVIVDKQFKTLDDVRKFVDDVIASKLASLFRDGIRMLPERWRKVIENDGLYPRISLSLYIFLYEPKLAEKSVKIKSHA